MTKPRYSFIQQMRALWEMIDGSQGTATLSPTELKAFLDLYEAAKTGHGLKDAIRRLNERP
jgi:hypothetical protein